MCIFSFYKNSHSALQSCLCQFRFLLTVSQRAGFFAPLARLTEFSSLTCMTVSLCGLFFISFSGGCSLTYFRRFLVFFCFSHGFIRVVYSLNKLVLQIQCLKLYARLFHCCLYLLWLLSEGMLPLYVAGF